mmetsp:Transcript_109282/g.305734  ORF Transcript_109282/g.305734 Transcript_109282/m.305734 type:complete len:221 (-) Transcript_109282:129-791(-)
MFCGAAPEDVHARLVAQVKELQKRDPSAKEQWIKYTLIEAGGTRDPSKHSAEFLQTFLSTRHAIEVPPPVEASPADLFKEAQKNSPTFRQCWTVYRQAMGNKYDDPSKHSADTLAGALEFVGHATVAMMLMGQLEGQKSTLAIGGEVAPSPVAGLAGVLGGDVLVGSPPALDPPPAFDADASATMAALMAELRRPLVGALEPPELEDPLLREAKRQRTGP